ncbi:aminopeptidase P family protein [Croceicoccus ponticola]|uniref:Aminopeptidase P family protein n=1 Tax=Croceicoccus ponticola TaxID=2217664 RepID=A0A437GZ82_9SPHN|nr:aminopeptidase P family protein [Croceicoccus ponticola]RVQ67886.1 aminopeptidase P family protein [Croceicoccus ponticola]
MQTHEARLAALREELKRRELDGFVVPISDEHMSEYVGEYAQRLEWLTGFGGSAGTAVVLANAIDSKGAAMFVDGRYTIQVRDQVDGKLWDYESIPQTSPAEWLGRNVGEGARIGFDPWLHSPGWAKAAEKALAKKGATLVAVETNPIDSVWQDRPAPSTAFARPHDEALAGRSSAEKRGEIAEWLVANGYDATVITALDSIAWLFNIRGNDVSRTPVALSFAIVHADGTAELFMAPEKVTPALSTHLGNAVTLRDRAAFEDALAATKGQTIAVDPDRSVAAIFRALNDAGAIVKEERDPVVLPKAIKTGAEQNGHRAAQSRDGAAVAKFLNWIAREAPSGRVTELDASDRLEAFRAESDMLTDLSFDTISGAGPNGAVVHYRVSEETNRTLQPNSVYLVDSGGQYADGTTDITRTVWVGPGEAPAEVKDRFTRVLKGHIALATAVFPKGTVGSQLDTLARMFLWQAGVDYAHGTGHGVGSYLSVHEGPQNIGKGGRPNEQPLLPGMFLSNEPGYYKTGEYGIRIENLVLVIPQEIEGAETEMMGFETLTFAPIDRNLIDVALLTEGERGWIDDYHAKVLAVVGPQLAGEALGWLEVQCAPLSR